MKPERTVTRNSVEPTRTTMVLRRPSDGMPLVIDPEVCPTIRKIPAGPPEISDRVGLLAADCTCERELHIFPVKGGLTAEYLVQGADKTLAKALACLVDRNPGREFQLLYWAPFPQRHPALYTTASCLGATGCLFSEWLWPIKPGCVLSAEQKAWYEKFWQLENAPALLRGYFGYKPSTPRDAPA